MKKLLKVVQFFQKELNLVPNMSREQKKIVGNDY
jgi:hypothetical protein